MTIVPVLEAFCITCGGWSPTLVGITCRRCGEDVSSHRVRVLNIGALPAGTRVRIKRPENIFAAPLWWTRELNSFDGIETEVAGAPVAWKWPLSLAYCGDVCYLKCHDSYLFQFAWLERLDKDGFQP